MKKSKSLFMKALMPALFLFLSAFSSDKDPLHNREFTVSLSETKNGVVAKKVIMDKFRFKDGKVYSDFLRSKFGFKAIRYRINKDSVYTDHTDTEVRLLEVEASATDLDNQTVLMEFSTLEWDIDGVIKITKNDRLKRYYDLSGREKGGKPKKEKKKIEENLQDGNGEKNT